MTEVTATPGTPEDDHVSSLYSFTISISLVRMGTDTWYQNVCVWALTAVQSISY